MKTNHGVHLELDGYACCMLRTNYNMTWIASMVPTDSIFDPYSEYGKILAMATCTGCSSGDQVRWPTPIWQWKSQHQNSLGKRASQCLLERIALAWTLENDHYRQDNTANQAFQWQHTSCSLFFFGINRVKRTTHFLEDFPLPVDFLPFLSDLVADSHYRPSDAEWDKILQGFGEYPRNLKNSC